MTPGLYRSAKGKYAMINRCADHGACEEKAGGVVTPYWHDDWLTVYQGDCREGDLSTDYMAQIMRRNAQIPLPA